MTCPNCGVTGKGPRFEKRHPKLCERRAEERQAIRSYNEQLAQGTHSVDWGELPVMTIDEWNSVKEALSKK